MRNTVGISDRRMREEGFGAEPEKWRCHVMYERKVVGARERDGGWTTMQYMLDAQKDDASDSSRTHQRIDYLGGGDRVSVRSSGPGFGKEIGGVQRFGDRQSSSGRWPRRQCEPDLPASIIIIHVISIPPARTPNLRRPLALSLTPRLTLLRRHH
jgi:hypothetical protein